MKPKKNFIGKRILAITLGAVTAAATLPYSLTDVSTFAAEIEAVPVAVIDAVGETEGDYTYTVRTTGEGEQAVQTVEITKYNGSGGTVDIPATIAEMTVTAIGERAFYGDKNITSVAIPAGVTTIGKEAFSGCEKLAATPGLEAVTSIGDWAFFGCESLADVTIPAGVTSIGEGVFSGCKSLVRVTIPETVTSISVNAFSDCESLPGVTLPTGLTNISANTFSNCRALTNITIPINVTTIGKEAFSGCLNLAGLVVPAEVTSIGESAFSGCEKLATLEFGTTGTTGSTGTTGTAVSKLAAIGENAFFGCSSLTSVSIPASVTSIGSSTFGSCTKLETITVAEGNIKYDSRDNCNAIIDTLKKEVVAGCKTSVIPNDIVSIGNGAFANCSGLVVVNLPGSVTSIGESAFSGCYDLVALNMANGVATIGNSAFSGCRSLASVDLPNSVTSIGESAFSGCTGLASARIPVSVATIGKNAFSGCYGLVSVSMANGVTTIGEGAFSDCRNLVLANIPGSVTSIGKNAFSGCIGLTGVSIPGTLQKLENGIFSGCSSLTSVDIPASVKEIGEEAFSGCSSLTTLTIPHNALLESIAERAFSGCPIAKLDLPESLKDIKEGAFANTALTEIAFYGKNNLTHIGRGSFENTAWYAAQSGGFAAFGGALIGYPGGQEEETVPDSTVVMADYAFYGNESLKKITVPGTVTSIAGHAFEGSSALETVVLGEGVTVISDSAFLNCANLKEITVPKSVTQIDEHAIGWQVKNNGSTTVFVYDKADNLPTILCYNGTAAYNYAVQNGIPYRILTEGSENPGTPENPDNPTEKTSLAGAAITLSHDSFIYDGTEKKPEVTSVILNGRILEAEKDYTVAYYDNVEIGTAMVVVTGTGNYNGAAQKPFEIMTGEGSVVTVGAYKYELTSSSTAAFAGLAPEATTWVTIPGTIDVGGRTFTVMSVAPNALKGERVQSVVIGTNVIMIEENAFSNCTSLQSVSIPVTVIAVGRDAFYGCTSLRDVYYGGLKTGWDSIDVNNSNGGNDPLKQASIHYSSDTEDKEDPDPTQDVGSVLKIGEHNYIVMKAGAEVRFAGTTSTSPAIKIPATVEKDGVKYKVTSIAKAALKGNKKVTQVTIGKNVTFIGKKAFFNCNNLRKITMKTVNLKTVKKNALKGIASNAKIRVPASKLSDYEKLLKGKGQGSKVKIKAY